MPWEHARYCGLGMNALVIVCSRNTNVLMVWEWMQLLSHALGTRTLLWFGHGCAIVCSRNTNVIIWFGHGCTCYLMLSEHERYYGLGMVALFLVCVRNTNVIVVWAWVHYLSYVLYALETRTLLWFGHGCTCYLMLSEHERYYGLGMVALFLVCFRNTNVIVVWAWVHYLSYVLYALGTRTLLYGLGMVALFIVCSVIVCSRNTNIIMVWAWMRDSMLSEHERYYIYIYMVWAWMHLLSYALRTRTLLWFWAWMLNNTIRTQQSACVCVYIYIHIYVNTRVVMT